MADVDFELSLPSELSADGPMWLYDAALACIGIIAEYESCIVTRRYSEHSEFTAKLPMRFYADVASARFVSVASDDEPYLVEKIAEQTDETGKAYLTVSGRSATALLEIRAVTKPKTYTNAYPAALISGMVATAKVRTVTSAAATSTFIFEAAATTNYASASSIYVGQNTTADTVYRSLVRYTGDFEDLGIPAGATVTSVLLRMKKLSVLTESVGTMVLHRVKRADWVAAEATWNVYKTGSNWGTAGAANTSTDIDGSPYVNFDETDVAIGTWFDIDITDLLTESSDPEAIDVNLRIGASSASAGYRTVFSDSPYLVVNYTITGEPFDLLTGGTGPESAVIGEFSAAVGELDEVVLGMLQAHALGMSARMVDGAIAIDVIQPDTDTQYIGPVYGNSPTATRTQDDAPWRNYAVVFGAGGKRVDVDLTDGDERRELYVDGGDSMESEDGTQMTEDAYTAFLEQKGTEALAEAQRLDYVDAQTALDLRPGAVAHYATPDWDVDFMVTEAVETREGGQVRYQPTFGVVPPLLLRRIGRHRGGGRTR